MNESSPRGSAGCESAPVLEVSYFTDPLCCWSWGFEPQLRRLRYAFAGRIAWRLLMGGLIRDWDSFGDPLNDVHRPIQMGPLAIQVAGATGMPINSAIWAQDAPASSWPSCVAVKAAGLQGPAAADLYLRLLREALMLEGRNIAREDVLIEVGGTLAEIRPDLFDAERFATDLAGGEALVALKDDVRQARFRGVGRFPALELRRPGTESAWLVGWRPWEELIAALHAFAPHIGPERPVPDAAAYARYWGGATDQEAAVALRASPDRTADPNHVPQGRAESAQEAW